MDDNPLDEVDRSILHQLQLNARQTDTEIAEKVDVTSTTVRNRLDKLEEKGVIRGYYPEINYEQAGYPSTSCSFARSIRTSWTRWPNRSSTFAVW
ncbi:winged helix-turn-helix transcriptional regulator [Haloarculaceae archaeon H-GB11]|nr:winged helix-turn-helix transcriptional regulator [Haloarculaceae archaeon H-GB11]